MLADLIRSKEHIKTRISHGEKKKDRREEKKMK
jgi:hypothetical protein